MESNYCSICGSLLNEGGFCSDPECNIPGGFTPKYEKKFKVVKLDEEEIVIEPTWENNNFN